MNFYTFLVDNWRLIAEGLFLVVSFILFVTKKRPVNIIDSVKEFICDQLPMIIRLVEVKSSVIGMTGADKKKYALDLLKDSVKQIKGFELDSAYLDYASKQIEDILACPQKKEF